MTSKVALPFFAPFCTLLALPFLLCLFLPHFVPTRKNLDQKDQELAFYNSCVQGGELWVMVITYGKVQSALLIQFGFSIRLTIKYEGIVIGRIKWFDILYLKKVFKTSCCFTYLQFYIV